MLLLFPVVVAAPALIMAVLLTRNPARTLLLPLPLNLRSLTALPAAMLLAVLLFPLVQNLSVAVQWVYPVRIPGVEVLTRMLAEISPGSHTFWLGLAALALAPALCEELAFRGFILSGLRHQGHKWRAIIFSALMFGVAHGILQQSIMASLLGCVLGYLAVQSGSLWPGVVYHLTHNTIGYLSGLSAYALQNSEYAWLQMKYHERHIFTPNVMLVSLLGTLAILLWFSGFSYRRTDEEVLQETIDQQSAHSLAG